MTKLKIPAILLAIFLLFLVVFNFASRLADTGIATDSTPGPVILTDKQDEYPLGMHLEILKDPGGDLTIEQVSSAAYDGKFVPSQAQVPVFGFTDSAYWVRIKLQNETLTTYNWFLDVLYSNLHFVDLYTPAPDKEGYSVKQTGSARSPTTRDLRYPRVIFTLLTPPQSQETIYMRFQSGASMTLNLKLWSQRAFINHSIQEQIAFGIFFGVLIGLLFYNLFLLFAWKEKNYLYFVMLLACLILHEASYNGYLETYILPSLYFLKLYYHPILFTLLVVSMILFADSFLEFKQRIPKLHVAALVSVAGFGILVLLIPFISYRQISTLLLSWTFLSLLILLTAGIFNYLRGKFRPAPLFMFAWFSLIILFLDVLLVRLGITPSTFFSENTYRLGILLVAILWSISLADLVNLLKAEMEKANQELHKSELRLSQILDGMPLGVLLYTKDQKPKYANRTALAIVNDPNSDIRANVSAGRTLSQAIEYFSLKVAGSHESYPLEHFPAYSALQGKPASIDDIEMHRGDQNIPLEMWASPIKGEGGDVEAAVLVFQDITQRRMAEHLLIEYRKHLESLVDARTDDLNTTNKELRLRLEWLAAVNLVNQMIARSANFSEISERIVEIIKQLFNNQEAFIAELDVDNQTFKILTHTGSDLPADLIGSRTSLPERFKPTSQFEPGSHAMISKDEFGSFTGPMAIHLQSSNLQSITFVPLQVREHVLGFLGLEMREVKKTITEEEANLLGIFSTDMAQLIEDARLFEQAKLLVAAEERNRLARELHDSVAQTLYSISLFIDATRLALKTNKPRVVESHIDELKQLSREAMSDMRLLIFELRPPILEKSGLVAALQSRLESVEAKAGFETSFETDGSFHFSPAQESELYRIAQEALNNVVKHAQANRVVIRLAGESGCTRMVIEDDGVGFDPLTLEQGGGQGFRNMRERAANINARCSFESVPGQGTTITIEVNE
jgi:signal transduction histidine kinase/PAS domain-containing protein